jgi:hypothetical protein
MGGSAMRAAVTAGGAVSGVPGRVIESLPPSQEIRSRLEPARRWIGDGLSRAAEILPSIPSWNGGRRKKRNLEMSEEAGIESLISPLVAAVSGSPNSDDKKGGRILPMIELREDDESSEDGVIQMDSIGGEGEEPLIDVTFPIDEEEDPKGKEEEESNSFSGISDEEEERWRREGYSSVSLDDEDDEESASLLGRESGSSQPSSLNAQGEWWFPGAFKTLRDHFLGHPKPKTYKPYDDL